MDSNDNLTSVQTGKTDQSLNASDNIKPEKPLKNNSKKPLFKIIPIFLILLGLFAVFYLYTNRRNSTSQVNIPTSTISENQTTPQKFQNNDCLVSLDYPQRTTVDQVNYLWFLETKNDSVVINYQDRDPNLGFDQSLHLFAKKQADPKATNSTFILIGCSKNQNNLDIDTFYTKYNEVLGSGIKLEKSGLKQIGGVNFLNVKVEGTQSEFFLGVYKDRLYYIANTIKAEGKLQEASDLIIDNIKFI